MDIVEGHDNDAKNTPLAQLLPLLSAQLGDPLPLKKSKMRGRYGIDCGGRASACSDDMEISGQERREPRLGTKQKSGQDSKKPREGNLLSHSVFINYASSS